MAASEPETAEIVEAPESVKQMSETKPKPSDSKPKQVDKASKQAEPKPAANVLTFEATAYTARCEGCSGITASGHDVRNTVYSPEGYRIIAAPTSIPFGTVMRITLNSGESFTAIVLDRGGDITEGRLDYLVDTYEQAMTFGRQTVSVEILE